jgi:membrane fusion protein (multidrug efflux system)
MSTTFSRTLRSLDADRPRRRGLELLVGVLLAAWAAWFLLGQVTVYEVTDKARLEVTSAAHPVATQVAGKVVETRLAIGRDVQVDEVLVVLDSEAEQRALREKQTRRDALAAKLNALHREAQAEREALGVERKARTVAVEESRAQVEKAQAEVTFADRQLEMYQQLRRSNAAAEIELRKSKAEADVSRATLRSLKLAVSRLEQDRLLQDSDRKTRLAKLEREAVELEKEAAVAAAALRRLEHEIALRSIRAPISGLVGEVLEFPVGSAVHASEKLGAIVPPGQPRAVAWFPAAVIGRILPGQLARLRLMGFPWTRYGTLPARVAEVGNEASGGRIRVELSLGSGVAPSIPLGHGLPGSAEVEVEHVSPAILVLRAAGQFLGITDPCAICATL